MDTSLALVGIIILVAIYFYSQAPEQYTSYQSEAPAPVFEKPQQTLTDAVAAMPIGPLATSVNDLPKPPVDTGFCEFAPNPKELAGQNFVDASRYVSLGTMTSRRNINRDLRGDLPIPKDNSMSIWNQSTIDQQQHGKLLNCN